MESRCHCHSKSVDKLFLYQSGSPVKPRVLVLTPLGVTAININGITKHSGLNIPCNGKLMSLSDKNHAELRNKYSEVQIDITDEILMVSGKLLHQIHKRLNEIFIPEQDIPFCRKSVLVRGDFYQLPLVQAKLVFMFNETEKSKGFLILHLWHKMKLAKLTEIMCQKDDTMFIELLNKITVGVVDVSVDYILKPRFVLQSEGQYPYHALYILAKNDPENRYNECMLFLID